MKLANPFPSEVRLLFLYCHECWLCGRNGSTSGGMELHHIWGRISASALNAAPLCNECHTSVLHTHKVHQILLRKTINYLARQAYKLKAVDFAFLSTVQNDLRGFTV